MNSGSFYVKCLLFIALAGISIASLGIGSTDIPWNVIFDSMANFDESDHDHITIVHLRIPRTLLALFVGASLAVSGYLMQLLVNNPLADPYLLGTSSGAALGANIVFLGILPFSMAGIYMPTVAGFIGAFIVTVLAILVAQKTGMLNPSHLLLAGIALSSLATAFLSILIFISAVEGKVRTIVFWMLGSFEKAGFKELIPGGILMLVILTLLTIMAPKIHVLMLGSHRANNIGLPANTYRWSIIVSACLLTSMAVTLAGPVGFVGLIIPHFIRGAFGAANRYNLIFAALSGGTFTLLSDILSRLLVPPSGMPVGIVTSFLGIPFFIYLLTKKNLRFQ